MQILGIESFYFWKVFWPEVLKHFKHKNCVVSIKIFKSIHGLNLYKSKYIDHCWRLSMFQMFQYLGPKYVSSRQNVSVTPICILLQFVSKLLKRRIELGEVSCFKKFY